MNEAAKNTDVEIWREDPENYSAPSIHVTKQGAIGISVGGLVIVQSVRDWHKLAVNHSPCINPLKLNSPE